MKHDVLKLFSNYPEYALVISISINILIAVIGVLPSVFLTAANILFFGFWEGALISAIGESVGALIAFLLYRVGFKKQVEKSAKQHPTVDKLLQAEGREAFLAIISLRLIPFVPSGIITFTAAIGRVNWLTFFMASTIGKIPALLMEAYAAYEVTAFGWQGKVILLLIAAYFIYLVIKKRKSGKTGK